MEMSGHLGAPATKYGNWGCGVRAVLELAIQTGKSSVREIQNGSKYAWLQHSLSNVNCKKWMAGANKDRPIKNNNRIFVRHKTATQKL